MMNKQKYYISVVYHNVMRGLAIYCGLILGIIVILKLTGDRYGIVSILVLLEYVGIKHYRLLRNLAFVCVV